MKCEQPMCWWCAWRHIIGSGNDPTISCGHSSEYVRRQFQGSSTARTCKEYVEDDPHIKIKINRDTRESFMKAIQQMAVDSGHFAEAEAILWTIFSRTPWTVLPKSPVMTLSSSLMSISAATRASTSSVMRRDAFQKMGRRNCGTWELIKRWGHPCPKCRFSESWAGR